MSYAADHPVRCSHPDCGASFPDSKWDQLRAQREGWFFQKDGSKWCPAHVPEWVARWRAKQQG